jgi:hypothetical protein
MGATESIPARPQPLGRRLAVNELGPAVFRNSCQWLRESCKSVLAEQCLAEQWVDEKWVGEKCESELSRPQDISWFIIILPNIFLPTFLSSLFFLSSIILPSIILPSSIDRTDSRSAPANWPKINGNRRKHPRFPRQIYNSPFSLPRHRHRTQLSLG